MTRFATPFEDFWLCEIPRKHILLNVNKTRVFIDFGCKHIICSWDNMFF